MKVKFKRLYSSAVNPSQGKQFDTGHDLTAVWKNKTKDYVEYGTGIAVQIQPGYGFETRSCSSISNYDLVLANSVGTIDNGYQGEIIFRFKIVPKRSFSGLWRWLTNDSKIYEIGDRIGQIMIEKTYKIDWEEVDEFPESTIRGKGGFGSTNKKEMNK
jgi:dUTP pyrophosphatase